MIIFTILPPTNLALPRVITHKEYPNFLNQFWHISWILLWREFWKIYSNGRVSKKFDFSKIAQTPNLEIVSILCI